MVCLPAIVTTAYFVAIILLDLYNRDWQRIPGHALFSVFAVLLISFICERASEGVAWILLGAPLLLVALSYLASTWFTKPSSSDLPIDPPSSNGGCRSCPCCHYRTCRCHKPCWKPKPSCPKCKDCPSCPECPMPPAPKPKPDNCIKSSLDE